MTKAQIINRLYKAKLITGLEALTLLIDARDESDVDLPHQAYSFDRPLGDRAPEKIPIK